MKTKQIIFLSLAASLATAASAQFTIVGHTFDGGTSTLDGATVDTVAAGVGTAWDMSDSNTSIDQNGDVTATGSKVAQISLGSVINGAKGTANGIFTLTTVMDQRVTSGTNWLSTGFAIASGSVFTTDSTAGIGTAIWRGNGAIDTYNYDSSIREASPTLGTTTTAPLTITAVYDLSVWDGTSNFGTVTWSSSATGANTVVGTFAADYSFAFLSLGSSTDTGSFQSIQLTQVPEPSTFALLAGLATLGLVMLRRRRMR
jgi:hypothetical protein